MKVDRVVKTGHARLNVLKPIFQKDTVGKIRQGDDKCESLRAYGTQPTRGRFTDRQESHR